MEHHTSMSMLLLGSTGGCCGLPLESYQQAEGVLFTNCAANVVRVFSMARSTALVAAASSERC